MADLHNPNSGNHEFGLVMPFIACESQGGPFDDGAFTAGAQLGQIMAELAQMPACADVYRRYVDTRLVAQLDLVAMDAGFILEHEAWDEYPNEWTLATFTRGSTDVD